MHKRNFVIKLNNIFEEHQALPRETRGIPMVAVITDGGKFIDGTMNKPAKGLSKKEELANHPEVVLVKKYEGKLKNPILYSLVEPCNPCVDELKNHKGTKVFYITENINLEGREFPKDLDIKKASLNTKEKAHIRRAIKEWKEYQKYNNSRHGKETICE